MGVPWASCGIGRGRGSAGGHQRGSWAAAQESVLLQARPTCRTSAPPPSARRHRRHWHCCGAAIRVSMSFISVLRSVTLVPWAVPVVWGASLSAVGAGQQGHLCYQVIGFESAWCRGELGCYPPMRPTGGWHVPAPSLLSCPSRGPVSPAWLLFPGPGNTSCWG